MRNVLKLLIGVILLLIGIYLATQAGQGFAGGGGKGVTVPLGTVKIDYSINGE